MDYFKTLSRFNTQSAKWDGIKKKVGHDDYLVFSVADSDYPAAPAIIEALHQRVNHGAFGYTMVEDAYFNALKEWVHRRYGYKVEKHWMLTSPKVLTALSLMVDTLTPKDAKIAIQTPVYNMFYTVIEQNQRTLVSNPLRYDNGTYSMDITHLEETFKSGVSMFILCNPHNPVGRVWTIEELNEIVHLCKKYNVLLVSDEIHGDIIMAGHTFTSAATFWDIYPEIIVVTAPSKTFNLAGLQTANIFMPSTHLRKTIKTVLRRYFLSTPNLMGLTAAKTAYTHCDDWLNAQNKHIEENYQTLLTFFKMHIKEAIISKLEGTYLVWIDLTYLALSSQKMVRQLMDHGIVVGDGKAYGKQCDGFIRMNIACSKEQLKTGLIRLKKWIDSQH